MGQRGVAVVEQRGEIAGCDGSIEINGSTISGFTAGTTASFTIVVKNLGPDTAVNVDIDDTLVRIRERDIWSVRPA